MLGWNSETWLPSTFDIGDGIPCSPDRLGREYDMLAYANLRVPAWLDPPLVIMHSSRFARRGYSLMERIARRHHRTNSYLSCFFHQVFL